MGVGDISGAGTDGAGLSWNVVLGYLERERVWDTRQGHKGLLVSSGS